MKDLNFDYNSLYPSIMKIIKTRMSPPQDHLGIEEILVSTEILEMLYNTK